MMRPKSSLITTLFLLMIKIEVNFSAPIQNSELKLEIRSNSSLPYVAIGSTIALDCVLLQNNRSVEGINFDWLHPQNLPSSQASSHSWTNVDDKLSRMTINNMEIGFGGVYTCKTKHNGDNLSATAQVQPVSGIEFASDCKTEQYVLTNHSEGPITCSVVVKFDDKVLHHSEYDQERQSALTVFDVHIQWFKNEKPYTPPSGRCHLDNSVGIVCDPFVDADAGVYTIVASIKSPMEQSISQTIVIETRSVPLIQDLPAEVSAVENSTVKLRCRATGRPTPTYSWYNSDYDVAWRDSKRVSFDAKSGTLIIREVSRLDAGFVACHATNVVGSDIKMSKLVVTNVKGIPLKNDKETLVFLQNDSKVNDSPNPYDSATVATDLSAVKFKVILCFAAGFVCLMVVFFYVDVGCYFTRRRGVIALLSNHLVK